MLSRELPKFESAAVDLLKYPSKVKVADPGEQITIGDMHGNALKLINFLVSQGVLQISPDDYNKIMRIYDRLYYPDAYEDKNLAQTKQDLQVFNDILGKAKITSPLPLVRLIGDELADRGANDYLTLKILEKLSQNDVKVEVLISNHSIEFLDPYEQGTGYTGGALGAYADQAKSSQQLNQLIEKKLIDRSEVDTLVTSHYTKTIRAISYTLSEDGKSISIYSHAGIGLNTIGDVAKGLGIIDKSVKFTAPPTAEELAKLIDRINDEFHKQYVEPKKLHEIDRGLSDGRGEEIESSEQALTFLIWNRRYQPDAAGRPGLDRPQNPSGYDIFFAHGHDSSDPDMVRDPTKGNVFVLDTNFGKKWSNYRGTDFHGRTIGYGVGLGDDNGENLVLHAKGKSRVLELTATKKMEPPKPKSVSKDKTAQIKIRADLNLKKQEADASVKVYAPDWVKDALAQLSKKICPLTCLVEDEFKNKINRTFNDPLSLMDLQMIARNEPGNTSGVIAEQYKGIEQSDVLALKDLVKQCVVVGRDKVVAYGGYPKGKNPRTEIKGAEQKEALICDLSGLQFQTSSNTGRLCLVFADPSKQPQGSLDRQIFQNVVGENQKPYSDCGPPRYVDMKVSFYDEAGKKATSEVTCKFDTYAYQQFVKQDFILTAQALADQAKSGENLDFRFVKYGAGFFAQSLWTHFGMDPTKTQAFVEEQLKVGIAAGIEALIQTSPQVFDSIKQITLPFYGGTPVLSKTAQEFLTAKGVKVVAENIDALKPRPPMITATTNGGDPHATLGNEMRFQSLDAAIGENIARKGANFSPAMNPGMKQAYVAKPALAAPKVGAKAAADPKAVAGAKATTVGATISPELKALLKKVPTMEATLVGGSPKESIKATLPITDHEGVAAITAAGIIVTLNIWCPGSPIAPSLNPEGKKGQFRIEDVTEQKAQMQAMAKYLFDMAKAGVVGFMLQEVPNNAAMRDVLNGELKRLCAEHNSAHPEHIIDLEIQNYHPTKGTQSGTCALIDKEKLVTKDLTASIGDDKLDERFGHYLIQAKDNPEIQFDLYNVHGNFGYQNEFKDFVVKKANNGAMVCGDFNFEKDANEQLLAALPKIPVKENKKTGTLDGFIDPYTPSYNLALSAKAAAKKRADPKADPKTDPKAAAEAAAKLAAEKAAAEAKALEEATKLAAEKAAAEAKAIQEAARLAAEKAAAEKTAAAEAVAKAAAEKAVLAKAEAEAAVKKAEEAKLAAEAAAAAAEKLKSDPTTTPKVSEIEAAPAAGKPYVTAERLLAGDQYKKIVETVQTMGWKIVDGKTDGTSPPYRMVQDDQGEDKIQIQQTKLITEDPSDKTFEAMLNIFKSCHPPGQLPKITTQDAETKKLWESALAKVYPGETIEIQFALPPPAPSATPVVASKEEEKAAAKAKI